MNPKIYPVIMCGCYGSRLWPLSRLNLPKQFIKIFKGESLFQKSMNRVANDDVFEPAQIVSNDDQKYLLRDQLKELGIVDTKIFLEPKALSTAPAATIAALSIFEENPDALMFLLSSDSEIKDEEQFVETAVKAAEVSLAEQKYVLFGSKPQYPETGYGYIKSADAISRKGDVTVSNIHSFIEKPSESEAKACIKSGYYWNSGIFIIPVKLFLEEMEKFSPEIFKACIRTYKKSNSNEWYGNMMMPLNKEEFLKCPEDSIDYAVMEKTQNSAVVKADMGWFDVGSWQTFYELSSKNENGNATKGEVITLDVKNSNIFSNDTARLTAVLGVENLTVVQTNDATLIMPTSESQNVKKVVQSLKDDKSGDYLRDTKNYTEWGYIEEIRKESQFKLSKIFIKKDKDVEFSGNDRFKHFIVSHGEATFYIGRAKMIVKENDSLAMPQNIDYRIINNTASQIEILETETRDYQNITSASKNVGTGSF